MKLSLRIGAVGTVFFLVCVGLFFCAFMLPGHSIYTELVAPLINMDRENAQGIPVRIRIPAISVDASIEQIGLTPGGAMGVPADPANTAWFDKGPRPGAAGSAVIAGHEGWKNDVPAVFDNLFSLHVGDVIYVEDTAGTTTAFIVRETRLYGQNEDAVDVFSSNDGKAHLNLVTCEGVWNKSEKSYSGRLVVFADKEMTLGEAAHGTLKASLISY